MRQVATSKPSYPRELDKHMLDAVPAAVMSTKWSSPPESSICSSALEKKKIYIYIYILSSKRFPLKTNRGIKQMFLSKRMESRKNCSFYPFPNYALRPPKTRTLGKHACRRHPVGPGVHSTLPPGRIARKGSAGQKNRRWRVTSEEQNRQLLSWLQLPSNKRV